MAFQRLSDEEFVERIRRWYLRRRVLGLLTLLISVAGAVFVGAAFALLAYRIDEGMQALISDYGRIVETGPPRSFFTETMTQMVEVHMVLGVIVGASVGFIFGAFLIPVFFGLLQLLGTRNRSTELLLKYFDATREQQRDGPS